MDATSLVERLLASPTSAIMVEAAECIKGARAQADYEADIAEAALEKARELCAEKAGLEHIIAAQAEQIEGLRETLTDLTSANDHVEYGRALARARAALAQVES